MKSFQIILTTVFILIAVASVMVFSLTGTSTQQTTPKATVWGTFSNGDFLQLISNINSNGPVVDITYQQHDPSKIDSEFVNALAEGNGPDLIIFPDDKFLTYKNKLYNIPYKNFPARTYIDSFIDASSIFLGKNGVWAVPMTVDPLVMYWNKSNFNAAGLALPPKKWSEFNDLSTKLVKKNPVGGISQALVALGEYRNVNNAKDILTSMIFQARNPISAPGLDLDEVTYVIEQQTGAYGNAIPVISYYTSFSNPSSPMYTWNRSFANSTDAFSAGDVDIYFGKASELLSIRKKNPNLYFDVAEMPQSDTNSHSTVKATIYAISIVKNSKNIGGAFTVMNYLTNTNSEQFWSKLVGLPSGRRDLLSVAPEDPYQAIFYKAAIQSQTWLDPNPEQSSLAFQEMIESVTTGKEKTNSVVAPFANRLNNLYLTK